MSAADRNAFDGLWLERYRYQASEGTLYRELSQPSRRLILERNQALRADPAALLKTDGMRLQFTIPLEDMEVLLRKYPDLRNYRDKVAREAAWRKFARSSDSIPYRVK
jgi:hypothetical protein